MGKIRICDAIMGSGKTEAAIRWMNDSGENERFIFVTPYLSEVKRIITSCTKKNFKEPTRDGKGKRNGLKNLLFSGENIATTHKMFCGMNGELFRIAHENRYNLIMDESFYDGGLNRAGGVEFPQIDYEYCKRLGVIEEHKGGVVKWIDDKYDGKAFFFIKEKITESDMVYKDGYLFENIDGKDLIGFKTVTMLTYLFPFQLQRALFDMMNLEYSFIGVEKTDAGYFFTDHIVDPPYTSKFIDRIRIIEDDRVNNIGDVRSALCVNWFKSRRRNNGSIKALGRNIHWAAYQEGAKSADAMWTVYKEHKDMIDTNGYKGGFVSCNCRASNEYCNRWFAAYCVNVFINPVVKRYFESRHIYLDSDGYALSEMVQWVWRSSVRSGGDIVLYIPSSRMRQIFKEWLLNLADGGHGREFAGRKSWTNMYNKGRPVPERHPHPEDDGVE